MSRKLFAAIALIALISLSAAQAQRRPGGNGGPADGPGGGPEGGPRGFTMMMPLMRALDTDGDGEISAREIKKAVNSLKSLDKDGNGKLSQEELRPEMPGGPAGAGASGPGGPGGFGGPPSPDMFVNRAMEFDADQDGKLSKEELAKMAEGFMRTMRGGPAGGAGERGAIGPGGTQRGRPPRAERNP